MKITTSKRFWSCLLFPEKVKGISYFHLSAVIEHKEDEKGQDEAVTTSILLYKYIPNTYMGAG